MSQTEQPTVKLCSNCAYRATCNKRFSVSSGGGEVKCLDHAFDVAMLKKETGQGDDGNTNN
ncbi:MAG TPA: hypothetical protein PKH33_06565 [bacterium]|nr:hypothetical protein [bacterium]